MNERTQTMDTPHSPKEYEPLTVLPVADHPRWFYVLGESGWWYFVTLDCESEPATCECPDRKFRGRPCKHLKAVGEFVAAGLVEQAAKEIDAWSRLSEDEKKAVFR